MLDRSILPLSGPVVVTGAAGFLGRYVCERLVARGISVRGVVRRSGAIVPAGVEPVVVPDVLDRRSMRRAMTGAGGVIHLAARVHVMDDFDGGAREAYRLVNVEGTRAVLEEAMAAGASAFVLASSVKAAGESTDKGTWGDEVVAAPVDDYGRSKLEAERLVMEPTGASGMRLCILRLPLLYGARVKGNMHRLFDLVHRGVPLPFGLVNNRRALMYAGNAAAAIEAAVVHIGPLPPTPFFVSDGADISTGQLVRDIACALGRPARLLPVPAVLIRGLGRAGDVISTVMPFPFRSAESDRLLGSLRLDVSRYSRVTGFAPPFTRQQGLAETARWYVASRAPVAAPAPSVAPGPLLEP
ncbi:MAG: NAD-dependent epimerase/dehydratase family protein [Vicinamibacterales bacterium]